MNNLEITTLIGQLTVVGNRLNKKVVSEFKVVELKKIASHLKIKGYSKLLKKDLVVAVLKSLLNLQEENKQRSNKRSGSASTAVATKTRSAFTKLTREEFRNFFIRPLEKAFGYKTYFSGKESEGVGLGKISGRYYGWSFTSRSNAPIVISFRPNQQDTLRTLVHEYAHSILHRVGTNGSKLNKAEKEIEAETVAKSVIEGLGLTYTNHWYLPHFKDKYVKKTGEEYAMSTSRKTLINTTVKAITNTLSAVKDLANKLIGKEAVIKKKANNGYKYEVCCPTCTASWKYKAKGKVVKNAHKYYCNSCGIQTKGKFIVKEL